MFAGPKKGAKSASAMASNGNLQNSSKFGSKFLKGGVNPGQAASLSSASSKSQSQEDLTKPKERQQRTKTPGSGTGVTASGNRRTGPTKDSAKSTEKSREKGRSSSKSSSSSVSSGSRGPSALSRRAKDPAAKQKLDLDKAALEGKIKDLMSMAKTKDSEIRSLKAKLDQMMHLLNKQQDDGNVAKSSPRRQLSSSSSTPLFSSLVKLSDDGVDRSPDAATEDVRAELNKLQDENTKLREQMDVMMMTMKQKENEKSFQQQQDVDVVSNDGLSSSLDDLASVASGDALLSCSVSRSTSTENLLDEVGYSHRAGSHTGDKTSEDCLSESSSVTVANLTERIHRMEESHISTNEELEATVQELTDLQKSVPELTIDNDRLQKDKDFLLVKLTETEKKLSDQTVEAEHLRALVSDHLNDDAHHSDLKQQYVHLLNEREQLIRIQESMSKELRVSEEERKKSEGKEEAFKERLRHLEREITQVNTEKSMLEKRLKETKANAEGEHTGIVQKLEEDLRKERQRMLAITGTLQDCGERPGINMFELVDTLRSEKQELEERFLLMEEDFSQCQNENEKLDARVAELEEDLEATNAKSKKDLSELSELIDRLQEDLRIKQASLDEASETLFVMEDSVEQHIAVKKHDNHTIQQLNNQISGLKEERFRLEKEIQQLKKEQRNQTEEWKQFQTDLQMAVMIANDMKAETQSEVSRLREENQVLDEAVTKLRVENEQLRRRRVSSVSATSASILEAAALRQSANRSGVENNLASLRDSYKRRSGENSPGVQSLIKSFDSQSTTTGEPPSPVSPTRAHPPQLVSTNSVPNIPAPGFSPVKSQMSTRSGSSPITATVSPIQRHHSMTAITTSVAQGGSQPSASFTAKLQSSSNGDSASSSKPGTPDSNRSSVAGTDLTQLSNLLRHSSSQESRKTTVDGRKPQHTEMRDRLPSSRTYPSSVVTSTPITTSNTKHRSLSVSTPSGDPLATLARRYGGSKRNALLKWCQEKILGYDGIDITNFSSSWSDGLAFCALLHAYLPAHIPYDSLRQTYISSADEKTRAQLKAKNFRLAFAAAESVGIEPTLSAEEMSNKDRPDWQRVMSYVTQIYKYFET